MHAQHPDTLVHQKCQQPGVVLYNKYQRSAAQAEKNPYILGEFYRIPLDIIL